MSTSRERAAADRFFADLMGLSGPRVAPPRPGRAESVAEFFEKDDAEPDLTAPVEGVARGCSGRCDVVLGVEGRMHGGHAPVG